MAGILLPENTMGVANFVRTFKPVETPNMDWVTAKARNLAAAEALAMIRGNRNARHEAIVAVMEADPKISYRDADWLIGQLHYMYQ